MMTALLIVLLVLVTMWAGFMVYSDSRGCLLANLWLCFGGLGEAVKLLGQLFAGIIEAVSDQ